MNVLFPVLACILLLLAGHHEHVRYRHAYADCAKQQKADQDLLNRDVCFIYEDRIRFRSTVDCEGAERRLRVTILTCAVQQWFLESNVAHLYHRLTGNFWALFATIMTPLLVGMYLYSKRSTELAVMDRMERIMGPKKMGTAVSYR